MKQLGYCAKGYGQDDEEGTPGAEGRDAWHRNTATAGATVTGAFYKLRWRDQPGKGVDSATLGGWCYCATADAFVICAPATTHKDTLQACDEASYQLRMWRGQERIFHCHSDNSGELGWVCK